MNFTTWKYGKQLLFAVLFVSLLFQATAQSQQLWKEADASVVSSAERYSTPNAFRTLQLDITAMRSTLSRVHKELTEEAKAKLAVISVPMPDGSMSDVSVQEVQVMSPGLASRYPMIKTYRLKGITDPYAYGRIDVTQFGFHAMILSPSGQVFIDPVKNESDEFYISYFKKDLAKRDDFVCLVKDDLSADHLSVPHSNYQNRSSGEDLLTYRLALACTGGICRLSWRNCGHCAFSNGDFG